MKSKVILLILMIGLVSCGKKGFDAPINHIFGFEIYDEVFKVSTDSLENYKELHSILFDKICRRPFVLVQGGNYQMPIFLGFTCAAQVENMSICIKARNVWRVGDETDLSDKSIRAFLLNNGQNSKYSGSPRDAVIELEFSKDLLSIDLEVKLEAIMKTYKSIWSEESLKTYGKQLYELDAKQGQELIKNFPCNIIMRFDISDEEKEAIREKYS